jgi:hypothetical protein
VALAELFNMEKNPAFQNPPATSILPRLYAHIENLEEEEDTAFEDTAFEDTAFEDTAFEDTAFEDIKSLQAALIRAGVREDVAADYCANILWVLHSFGVSERIVCHQTLGEWVLQLFFNHAEQLHDNDHEGSHDINSDMVCPA